MSVARANYFYDDQKLPELPYESWKDTLATLHMWTQVVGKVRLELCPLVNHWWNVPLYVSARGLTTSVMPYERGDVEIWFDFIDHKLQIATSQGDSREVALRPQSVAEFYQAVMTALSELGVRITIWTTPCEIPNPIPFEKDSVHAAYDQDAVAKFWRILVWVDDVLKQFRAPERPGADAITREAYSHEVSSAGFWPGGGEIAGPAFYSYAAPEPAGFAEQAVRPEAAFYHPQLKEFLLMYDDARTADSPKQALLDFLQSTYEAAADLGRWDRKSLER